MFIETELTPNPATLKFLPGRHVMPDGTLDIPDASGAAKSPLAAALFEIPGVAGVYFGADFITVDQERQRLARTQARHPRRHHGTFHLRRAAAGRGRRTRTRDDEPDEFFAAEDAETVETIKELIETRVRPSVAGDGGDIKFRGFRDGIVYLAMKGSCSGCPSSTATLRHGIENLLRHYVPAVQTVQPI